MTTSEPRLSSPRSRESSRLIAVLRRRSVRGALGGWLAINAVLLALAGDKLPFHASSLTEPPASGEILQTNLMYLEIFALMGLVHLLTRRRQVPDLAGRAPGREVARRETALVLGYAAIAMLGGCLLGHAFGWHAFGFHLDGMIIRTGQDVTPAETFCWAAYNLLAYAVVPYVVFRRRYTPEQLSLRSSNRRADLLLVVVVLVTESTVQLLLNPAVLQLGLRQFLLGVPLTVALSFAGTVLPTMILVYSILTPRYLALTGSVPATLVLGGLTYALLHVFDGWTNFVSPTDAVISLLYVLLFYTGPGMFKTFLTIRTGNASTHVWAYHAIAPHALIDTPMFVKVFGIR
ncbi:MULTISPECIES: hypothetical protein [Kribbella]|uniref:CAAX prenyl protease-like protein n=1 Tax=Kribbella karoonensis TaxID=324851 RepID=A0ABP4PSE7_9ACTN